MLALMVQLTPSFIAVYSREFIYFSHCRNIRKLTHKLSLLGSDLKGSNVVL